MTSNHTKPKKSLLLKSDSDSDSDGEFSSIFKKSANSNTIPTPRISDGKKAVHTFVCDECEQLVHDALYCGECCMTYCIKCDHSYHQRTQSTHHYRAKLELPELDSDDDDDNDDDIFNKKKKSKSLKSLDEDDPDRLMAERAAREKAIKEAAKKKRADEEAAKKAAVALAKMELDQKTKNDNNDTHNNNSILPVSSPRSASNRVNFSNTNTSHTYPHSSTSSSSKPSSRTGTPRSSKSPRLQSRSPTTSSSSHSVSLAAAYDPHTYSASSNTILLPSHSTAYSSSQPHSSNPSRSPSRRTDINSLTPTINALQVQYDRAHHHHHQQQQQQHHPNRFTRQVDSFTQTSHSNVYVPPTTAKQSHINRHMITLKSDRPSPSMDLYASSTTPMQPTKLLRSASQLSLTATTPASLQRKLSSSSSQKTLSTSNSTHSIAHNKSNSKKLSSKQFQAALVELHTKVMAARQQISILKEQKAFYKAKITKKTRALREVEKVARRIANDPGVSYDHLLLSAEGTNPNINSTQLVTSTSASVVRKQKKKKVYEKETLELAEKIRNLRTSNDIIKMDVDDLRNQILHIRNEANTRNKLMEDIENLRRDRLELVKSTTMDTSARELQLFKQTHEIQDLQYNERELRSAIDKKKRLIDDLQSKVRELENGCDKLSTRYEHLQKQLDATVR